MKEIWEPQRQILPSGFMQQIPYRELVVKSFKVCGLFNKIDGTGLKTTSLGVPRI